MTSIKTEVLLLTRNYVRSGGKSNRKQQLQRMLAFTSFCQDQGARNLAQVGQKYVMSYYRHNKHLSYPTRYNHFLAIAKLFELAGKKKPPQQFSHDTANEDLRTVEYENCKNKVSTFG